MQFHGRKRPPLHSYDDVDSWSHAKLYISPIPRTASEGDIRPVFERHGRVVEVVLFRDKKTGHQQGACFVKFATLEDAERAIMALHNQYTFPGEVAPIKLKYADGERERLGAPVDKLYVGCLNKLASKMEIEEIFSPYGFIEDIFIVRDELKQSRGCAFVKFSHRDMAVAAIRALNGAFIMKGCEQPLIVRFADPKKPRLGESRGQQTFGNPNFGHNFQEPVARPPLNFGDPMVGRHHQASHPMHHHMPRSSQPEAVSQLANQEPSTPCITERLPSLQQAPSNLSRMPLQQTDAPQKGFHSSQTVPFTQTSEKLLPVESPQVGNNAQKTAISLTMGAVPARPGMAELLDCDWSEHTCPDGYKYYYNCVTCESRWDKPEEFMLYEQRLQKLHQPQNSDLNPNCSSSVCSTIQVPQTPQELDRAQVQSERSPVIGPTCA